jgi:hypothetical protein
MLRKTLSLWVGVAALSALSPCWAEPADDTGGSPLSTLSWDRLQGRLAFSTSGLPLRTEANNLNATGTKVTSIALIGNYYLNPSLSLNQLTMHGLRATSGFAMGQRSAWWGLPGGANGSFMVDRRTSYGDTADSSLSGSTSYFGIGYTGVIGSKGSWGFSADLGVMSLNPGRIGRVFSGSQNLDDMVRDLRLSPVMQLGISYSF